MSTPLLEVIVNMFMKTILFTNFVCTFPYVKHLQGAFFNCSHPKISKYKKKNKVSELFPPKNVLSVERAMGGYFEGRRV